MPTRVQVDTVVITEQKRISDTLVLNVKDTVRIVQDRVKVQLVRTFDTIAVRVDCPSDTVKVSVVEYVPQVVYEERAKRWPYVLAIALIVAFSLYHRYKATLL
mgnify:CR=1 FL=1